ncbi:hypothetical protein [Brevibacillus choshinensis]|uniref:hypothetical protein n=1 Tax=Brevibacillus choshinensis TaxID=54911 RepID=UPI002E1F1796|nr:hypothetical protein [Brevibacillus choshinensis]
MELEHAQENSPYLLPWQPERHQEALTSTDIRHLIVEQIETGQPVGYVILAGLAQSHDSIELMRIFWLDVKETNERALSCTCQKASVSKVPCGNT